MTKIQMGVAAAAAAVLAFGVAACGQTTATTEEPAATAETTTEAPAEAPALHPNAAVPGATLSITGKGFGLEKDDGALSKSKQEEFPELGEARIVEKEFAREVVGSVIIFTLRQESLKSVNKDPKRAVSTWSDIFLIKIPADDVKTVDFTNGEYKYGGRQYTYKHESGLRLYYRMFVAHDKFYVLRVAGADLTERNEYVKLFFDNFNPQK